MKQGAVQFNQVSTDQALVQSMNRDAKTSGGIIGITMNESCLIQHYVTLAHTAEIASAVKCMSHVIQDHTPFTMIFPQ